MATHAQSHAKHLQRIIAQWPKDALRPITVQSALQRQLDLHYSNTQASSQPPSQVQAPGEGEREAQIVAPSDTPVTGLGPAASSGTTAPTGRDESAQINALYSLLEDRYARTYKTSPELLQPAFNPQYYDNLRAELQAAPQRGWLMRMWLKYGRIVRLS